MSKFNDNSITIYTAINNIREGKYAMPAFQRQFVWGMSQIEKLWDSILLDYPIATFLFWRVDDTNVTWDTYFCNFLQKVVFSSNKNPDSLNYELTNIDVRKTDTGILDGQQRLTSLFLSLLGETHIRPKFARKYTTNTTLSRLVIELNKKNSSVNEEYNDKKYDIKYTEKNAALSPTQFDIKNILKEDFKNKTTRETAIENAIQHIPTDSIEYARKLLNKLCRKIYEEEIIRYTEILDMKQDDALEMFVRFNSGGKVLRKSEITMSILEAYWPSAREEFGKILENSYAGFGTDFIIRAALMLYGDVVKSNINKNLADTLKNEWIKFKNALNDLENLLKEMKIDLMRFTNSWNVLLPIFYFVYYNKDYLNNRKDVQSYLLRAIFFSYFQSGTTARLQQMKNTINSYNFKITIPMLDQMNELRITEAKIEDILNSEKGSRVAGEVLYFINLEWLDSGNKYEQDHLHPAERFNETPPINVEIEDWKKWYSMRNRLPNLQLLEGRSNGSKNGMRLADYVNDMNNEQKEKFYTQALIPENTSLELKNFENFYAKRKEIIKTRLYELLS